MATIASIVEGHGEVEAVPILIRRIVGQVSPEMTIDVPRPIRMPRSKLERPQELERNIELAISTAQPPYAVLVLADSDDACPATLGPELLTRAQQYRSDVRMAVVLAKHEYESWFLAAAESLRGIRQLSATMSAPAAPEDVAGAKEWIRRQMPANRTYSETLDQPALTARFDMDLARRADSFDKLYRDVERLIHELANVGT